MKTFESEFQVVAFLAVVVLLMLLFVIYKVRQINRELQQNRTGYKANQ